MMKATTALEAKLVWSTTLETLELFVWSPWATTVPSVPHQPADGAISIGAVNDRNSVNRTDDIVASYSNYGPRLDDGDDDEWDELKPDLTATEAVSPRPRRPRSFLPRPACGRWRTMTTIPRTAPAWPRRWCRALLPPFFKRMIPYRLKTFATSFATHPRPVEPHPSRCFRPMERQVGLRFGRCLLCP